MGIRFWPTIRDRWPTTSTPRYPSSAPSAAGRRPRSCAPSVSRTSWWSVIAAARSAARQSGARITRAYTPGRWRSRTNTSYRSLVRPPASVWIPDSSEGCGSPAFRSGLIAVTSFGSLANVLPDLGARRGMREGGWSRGLRNIGDGSSANAAARDARDAVAVHTGSPASRWANALSINATQSAVGSSAAVSITAIDTPITAPARFRTANSSAGRPTRSATS
jgi:hypothetical protein